MTNHLGNVLASVSDKKIAMDPGSTGLIEFYLPGIVSVSDYYPFGSPMPGRQYSSNSYRYGYMNKEKDDEFKGDGNSYDFNARIYDSRLGRWLSLDPLQAKYVDLSPYNVYRQPKLN
jgi:RHS repeat-associated protein